MKYLPRDVAFAKMRAMVDGAKIVRAELRGERTADLGASSAAEATA